MEDPATAVDDAQSRRKSGRATQRPVRLEEQTAVGPGGKRKRGSNGAIDANGAEDSSDEEDDNESDPDEEEEKEQRRRARAAKKNKKPASKKPKVAKDSSVQLAMRPAVNGVKKPSKTSKARKPRPRPRKSGDGVDAGTGLYNEVFAQGKASDEVATDWLESYGSNPVEAMREFVNFVLKCTGCTMEVDDNDIEDVDNVANKLTDIQDEYVAQKITEYPLITKTKGSVFSRPVMIDFVETLLEAAHQKEVLYNDIALLENMQAWVTTMTSSSSRPFRHTATVIGLAMGSALCMLNRHLTDNIAQTGRQKDAEAKKKAANKERVKSIQGKIKELEDRRSQVEVWIKEIFDGVFVHRYRDVDPRIRVDCAQVLGSWIETCPDIFFVGEYMRYLGWVLSDVQASTRLEVLKQLTRLYKEEENAGRLNSFTERFKGRIVEMACQDADPNVRALAIELLEMIREMGFLEPEDIDSVGKLIFDADLKVRKSVKDFFAANINDTMEATVEELGGEDNLADALGEEDDEDWSQPKKSWLKFKCLAEVLDAYDADDADVAEAVALGADNLIDTGGGTRFTLAGEIACAGIEEIKEWESLAGYLLYDFSVPKGSKDPINVFKAHVQPDEKQESILLEILQVAVNAQLEEAAISNDRKKRKTDESRALQESTAQNLGQLLPRLLNKFGSNPRTVIAVLRLEQLLNLDIFQELRQDSSEFSALIDDISKQFMTHADGKVLEAARNSLLHAREAQDYAEVTETKVEEVWEDALKPLQQAAVSGKVNTTNLVNGLQRISNLASITDCVDLFERDIPRKRSIRSIEEYLRTLLSAYETSTEEAGQQILLSSLQTLLFYTLWKVKHTRAGIEAGEAVEWDLSSFTTAVTVLIEARHKLDDVRNAAIGVLLDAYIAQLSLRQIETEDESTANVVNSLIASIPAEAKKAITASFVAAEKDFAKRTKRNLDTADDVEEVNGEADVPESESDESEDEDDSDEQQKKHEVLRSERRLCELTGKIVLAIVGKILDAEIPGKGKLRRRIQKNKSKLGPHFREVLGYLDEPKTKAPRKAPQANGRAKAAQAKSKEIVESDDDDEDQPQENENEDGVEGDEEDLRRRGITMDKSDDADEPEAGDDEDDVMGD